MARPWQAELERARQAASLADWSAFQEEIDRLLARWGNHSDALLDASCGAHVIALSRASWGAMATSESPHWRNIHQQARQLLRVDA